MMMHKQAPYLLLLVASLAIVLTIGAGVVRAQTARPTAAATGPSPALRVSTVESRRDATGEPGAVSRLPLATIVPTTTATREPEEVQPTATGLLDEIVSTREPVPTATPGRIAEEVSEITTSLGLAGEEYLGLSADDWINLWISVLTSLFVFFGGTWLIGHALPRAARRTPTGFDDRFLEAIGPQLRWLVVLVTLYFATKRLVFVSADLKLLLIDLYFVLALVLGVQMVWKLIDLADRVYRERLAREGRKDELAPIITLLVRLSQVVVAVAGISILLSHFGIHITALAAALGLSSLAISLAARDTIADAISGFVILVDRPFRIGDRIEIQEVGTWGDVMDIGLRTTRIRTRDNRMVIVPNSIIGTNQVVNYTYPDPRYRVETHVSIAYGTDIEMARRIIIDAMGQVEGVLPDRPVDALYVEMGDSAMVFRVRWWIESYEDMRRMFDKVHTALQHAFDEERLESPYPTQSVNVRIGPGMSHPSEALVGHDGATQARGTTEG